MSTNTSFDLTKVETNNPINPSPLTFVGKTYEEQQLIEDMTVSSDPKIRELAKLAFHKSIAVRELQELLEKKSDSINNSEDIIDDLDNSIVKLEEKLESREAKIEQLDDTISDLKTENADLKTQLFNALPK